MHNLARDIEQMMADGLGGGLMIIGWQNETLEPSQQIEGQLPDQQIAEYEYYHGSKPCLKDAELDEEA